MTTIDPKQLTGPEYPNNDPQTAVALQGKQFAYKSCFNGAWVESNYSGDFPRVVPHGDIIYREIKSEPTIESLTAEVERLRDVIWDAQTRVAKALKRIEDFGPHIDIFQNLHLRLGEALKNE